jgi:hypothetical protein
VKAKKKVEFDLVNVRVNLLSPDRGCGQLRLVETRNQVSGVAPDEKKFVFYVSRMGVFI